MKINSKEAVAKLKTTAALHELYFELSKFEFKDPARQNAAKTYYSKINESLKFYNEPVTTQPD